MLFLSTNSSFMHHSSKLSFMKRIFVFVLLLFLSATSFSQQTNPSQPLSRADYLKKSKNLKTTGWIVFSGGVALITISAITILTNNGSYGVLLGVPLGVVITIASVPFFNASVRNKEKAKAASAFLKMETTPVIQHTGFVYRSYPAISVKISL